MKSLHPSEPDSANDRVSFVDGRWLPHREIAIHVDDVGFRQGVIAVERLRTYHQSLFALAQHLDRWQQTTTTLAIDGLPSRSDIAGLLQEVLHRNSDWIQARGDVGATMVATPGIPGANATLVVHLNPLDHDQIAQRRRLGQPLALTNVVQPDGSSWPRGIKTRARIHYYLADREARTQDPTAVGVLLDQDGSITETSIANLAIVDADTLLSPPADRVLGGITQAVIEKLAADESLTWQKQAIWPDQLASADEVLLMGTDGGIWFANSVNGVPVHDGKPGPVYLRLRARFDALVTEL